jgi:aerobic-type carbon monoxide dehydrogenase small subunit (CoxS/CutS family)
MTQRHELHINGATVTVDADPATPLLAVLRDALGLTGAKIGCGEGACGTCTVLVNGQATRSCVTPVASVAGQPIRTIEGLAEGGTLHPLQQAFLDQQAFQCGYCTPGMIMAAVALLESCPRPTEADIIAAMQGNICRCGTYPRIVRAIQQAAADPDPAEAAS